MLSNPRSIQYGFIAIFRLSRYCSASGMFLLARTDGFVAVLRKRVTSNRQKVLESTDSIIAAIAHCCDSL